MVPPDPTPAASKRQAIITAATEAFARDGFANARISDIAAAAQIGKGTVYEYFPSKEELLLACCLTRCAADRVVIHQAFAARGWALAGLMGDPGAPPLSDPLGALRDLLVIALTHLLTHASRDCRLFMELFALAGERHDMQARMRAEIHAVLAEWESLAGQLVNAGIAAGQLRPHPDVPGLCRMLSATVDGLLLQRSWRDDLAPAALAERITAAFLATLVVEIPS